MASRAKAQAKTQASVTSKSDNHSVAADELSMVHSQPIELVFGLVGPSGVDLDSVVQSLTARLKSVNYSAHVVSLSDAILNYDGQRQKPFLNGFQKISTAMDIGDDLRKRAKKASIIGVLGLMKLRAIRASISGDPNKPSPDKRVAYIVGPAKPLQPA